MLVQCDMTNNPRAINHAVESHTLCCTVMEGSTGKYSVTGTEEV